MLIKGLASLLAIILVAAVTVPQPKLISYQAAGKTSHGVYWPGMTGDGRLLDSTADFVKIDETTNNLHLCYRFDDRDNCQRYEVIKTFGLIDTVDYMFEHKLL